ncbi:hypothetical protein [Alteromonas antoniana]|uniref:hypothetical protein n=1 Tax=Alteromonas antoniana TaxID=2803813 RepID=UPI001C458B31|nr:hypothetical protein [Alteromonas antoniana]
MHHDVAELEPVSNMAPGVQYQLKCRPKFDLRKLKGHPIFVLLKADEEIGRFDEYGRIVIVKHWTPEGPVTTGVDSSAKAIQWLLGRDDLAS